MKSERLRELSLAFSLSSLLVIAAIVTVIADAGSSRSAQLAQSVGQDEVRIELSSNGFVPNEIQHAAGTFAIAVENSTLSGEYTLRLKAEDGTVLREVQVQQGSSAWTITLPAGQYTLTEAGNPQWLCRITVQ